MVTVQPRSVRKTPRRRRSATRRAGPEPRGIARQARSAARREAILAAALDEFSARGFEAARLDDVAKRAGVAKGTIYLYFRDKEALFQELVRTMLTPFVGALEALGAADVPIARAGRADCRHCSCARSTAPRRKDVIRLIMTRRPALPQARRVLLSRRARARHRRHARAAAARAERGEVPEALVEFPAAHGRARPGRASSGAACSTRFEPLDVAAMMRTHLDLLFATRRAP